MDLDGFGLELQAPDPDLQELETTPDSKKRKTGDEPDSTAKQPPATQGGRRHKPDMGKKGTRACKACQKTLALTLFALNQVVCMSCKQALDVVSKKAKAQNKVEWFAQVKADPKALKHLVNNYKNAVQEAEKTGVKRNFWNLAIYMEEVRASSETVGTDRGQLMWRDQAIEFWMSTDGGSMAKYEAEAKWNYEAANYQTLGTATDQKGPERAPLRLRVHTADLIDQVKRVAREKILSRILI